MEFTTRMILTTGCCWDLRELGAIQNCMECASAYREPNVNIAKKGELRCAPPTGYIYDPDGNLVFDPDESVVAAIRLVFQQFQLLGTAFKVMRYFAQNQIPFPRRIWRPGDIGTLHWGSVNHSRITAILHNPTYTGTYVYGRRRSLPIIESGQIARVKTQQLPQEEWKVIIHASHPAYISWEEYLENSKQLKRNHASSLDDGQLGTPREGRRFLWTKQDSLLVGLVSGVVRSVLYKAVLLCSEIL